MSVQQGCAGFAGLWSSQKFRPDTTLKLPLNLWVVYCNYHARSNALQNKGIFAHLSDAHFPARICISTNLSITLLNYELLQTMLAIDPFPLLYELKRASFKKIKCVPFFNRTRTLHLKSLHYETTLKSVCAACYYSDHEYFGAKAQYTRQWNIEAF